MIHRCRHLRWCIQAFDDFGGVGEKLGIGWLPSTSILQDKGPPVWPVGQRVFRERHFPDAIASAEISRLTEDEFFADGFGMFLQFDHPRVIFHLVERDGFQAFNVRVCLLHTSLGHVGQLLLNVPLFSSLSLSLSLSSPLVLERMDGHRFIFPSLPRISPAFLFLRASVRTRSLLVSCGRIRALVWSCLLQTFSGRLLPRRLPVPSILGRARSCGIASLDLCWISRTIAPSAEGRVRPCVRP